MVRTMRSIALAATLFLVPALAAQDTVYSGPQPGESIRPFSALAITGPDAGKEIQALSAGEGTVQVSFGRRA